MTAWMNSVPDAWAQPLGLIVLVLGAILLLYPLVWRLTVKQLSAALRAIEIAKELPELATKLEDLGGRFSTLRSQIADFESKLPDTSEWIERFETLTRLSTDLQKQIDSLQNTKQAPEASPTKAALQEDEIRDRISDIWWDIKTIVEDKIEDADGRRKRKYSSLTRYTYDEIWPMMVSDRLLTKDQGEALSHADATYRSLRNRRLPVTPDTCKKFEQWLGVLSSG